MVASVRDSADHPGDKIQDWGTSGVSDRATSILVVYCWRSVAELSVSAFALLYNTMVLQYAMQACSPKLLCGWR